MPPTWPIPDPDPSWRIVFSIGCYVSALLVLAQALHVRRALHGGRWMGAFFGGSPVFAPSSQDNTFAISEALLFGFFILNFYVLETWATYASPYFVYAQSFPLMLPTPPRTWLPAWIPIEQAAAGVAECKEMVSAVLDAHRTRTIPIEIPLMEATIAYVALHATQLAGATYWSRAFLAGFAVLALDALLDPVVSDAYLCTADPQLFTPGLGLWRWFTVPAEMGQWFGIPLFNFGAWYGSAVISVGVPGLLSAALRRGKAMRQPWLRDPLASDPGGPWEVLVWIGIVAAGLIVRTLNPIARSKADTAAQAAAHPAADAGAAAFVAVLLLSAFIAGLGLARRRADNWPRLALIVPPLFFLVFPLAVRFAGPQFDGAAWQFPWCFAIGIFSFCTSLVIYPYWRSLWPWSRRSSA